MNQLRSSILWRDLDQRRYFLTPAGAGFKHGTTAIVDATGERRSVDLTSLEQFEVEEQDALRWAREELGATLDELKSGIGQVLTDARHWVDKRNHEAVGERTNVTLDVAGAMLALLGKLPGVIGNSLSGDAGRVAVAQETLAGLDGQLRDASIKLDERFTAFADRLAGLREHTRPPS